MEQESEGMGGLRYDSMSDLPAGMRQQVAVKIMASSAKSASVAGSTKYGNKKTEVNGITFDSQKEAKRFVALLDALREGVIADLRLQQDFTLQEAYTTSSGERIQAIRYKADFTYTVVWSGGYIPTTVSFDDMAYWRTHLGERIIEDVKAKGTRTRVYINKYKMMADKGYVIREV
ncbi:MAG: DUF1064 domain-containing protein [Oscillospiraceae bacterium]|nr:DUF1064 domain-containing protein [Oscillospiraceae bacterium]